MTSLTVYGASDDLVEFEGAIRDEFDCYNVQWQGRLEAPSGEALTITAEYGPEGWQLSVSNVPGQPAPDWPIHFGERPDREDDPAIVIDVPEGTTITEWPPVDDE